MDAKRGNAVDSASKLDPHSQSVESDDNPTAKHLAIKRALPKVKNDEAKKLDSLQNRIPKLIQWLTIHQSPFAYTWIWDNLQRANLTDKLRLQATYGLNAILTGLSELVFIKNEAQRQTAIKCYNQYLAEFKNHNVVETLLNPTAANSVILGFFYRLAQLHDHIINIKDPFVKKAAQKYLEDQYEEMIKKIDKPISDADIESSLEKIKYKILIIRNLNALRFKVKVLKKKMLSSEIAQPETKDTSDKLEKLIESDNAGSQVKEVKEADFKDLQKKNEEHKNRLLIFFYENACEEVTTILKNLDLTREKHVYNILYTINTGKEPQACKDSITALKAVRKSKNRILAFLSGAAALLGLISIGMGVELLTNCISIPGAFDLVSEGVKWIMIAAGCVSTLGGAMGFFISCFLDDDFARDGGELVNQNSMLQQAAP